MESGDSNNLPSPEDLGDWSNDITLLPSITWRDVTTYLLDTPSIYTKDSLKSYKSLEAYDYFACGRVVMTKTVITAKYVKITTSVM